MPLFRHLLLLRSPSSSLKTLLRPLSRPFSFSSAEEAAAERRRRKRRLRIEPPLHALRRDPSTPRPPPNPNSPRLPDSTSSLVGPRLNLHNRVQSLIRSHDLDSASTIARHAIFSSTRPTVFTCNALVAAMYRSSRHDDAIALFHFFFQQSNIIPNVVSYNFLIVTYCDSGRVDDALAVYRRILDSAPFSPSYVTYRHLTKGLVDADRLPESLQLLREMIARGHGADSLVFNNVISGFLHRDQNLPKALELFDELRERCLVYDGTVVATFMDWYFQHDRPDDAIDAYRGLLDREFQMTPATCNNLLEVLLRHSRAAEAERLFDDMLMRHKPPTFHGLNTDTYNIMVNSRFASGDHDGAVEVFHRTGTKPLTMDVACFNNIIGKLLQNGLLEHAHKLFDEMPERTTNPDAETFGLFVDFYFREGKPDDALRWFESMVDQEGEKAPKVKISSYNVVYEGLVKTGRFGDAMDIFKKMWEKGVKPNSRSYEILVTALCNEGLLDQVRDLVKEMMKIRVPCPPELRQLVSDAFEKEGRGEEVEKMFEPPPPVVVPQTSHFRPPQTFQRNPNSETYRPPHRNAGNQTYSQNPIHGHGTQPPSPHSNAVNQVYYQNRIRVTHPLPPSNAGNHAFYQNPNHGAHSPLNQAYYQDPIHGVHSPPNQAYYKDPNHGAHSPPNQTYYKDSNHGAPPPPHNNAGNQPYYRDPNHGVHPPPYNNAGNQSYYQDPNHGAHPPPYHNAVNQAYYQDPNYGAHPPCNNAGNQAYYQDPNHGAHPPPNNNAGNQDSYRYPNHGAHPLYNDSNQSPHDANIKGPPQFLGPQDMGIKAPQQFSGHQATHISSMPPTQYVAGPRAPHLATTQPLNDARANSQHLEVPPFSSASPQYSNTMPSQYPRGESTHVEPMDSQQSYMGDSQAWQGVPSKLYSGHNYRETPTPSQISSSPHSSCYQAPNSGNPEAASIDDRMSYAVR